MPLFTQSSISCGWQCFVVLTPRWEGGELLSCESESVAKYLSTKCCRRLNVLAPKRNVPLRNIFCHFI